jgi:lipoate synthase
LINCKANHWAAQRLDILTLGQYLQPTKMHYEVHEFVHPDKFEFFKEEGLKREIKYVDQGHWFVLPIMRKDMCMFD